MKLLFNQCNLYFLLWCIYLLQGTLYSKGSIISAAILAVILIISLYHCIMVYTWNYKPKYMSGLELLVIMFAVYGLILMLTDGQYTKGITRHPPTMEYLKSMLMSLLPIFTCFYFSKKKILTRNLLIFWVPVFLIVAISEYYKIQREAIEQIVTGREDVTNNAGYILLSVIPCMYVLKNRLIQIIGIIVCFVLVLFSMKRGAILVSVVLLGIYLLQQLREMSQRQKLALFIGMIFAGIILFHYLEETLFQNDYFNNRMEQTLEGETSGRDDLYSSLWHAYWEKLSPVQQIVGMGGNGTLKIGENYAHNEWLEILINQGLVGIMAFVFYWVLFIKTLKDKNLPQISKNVLLMIFVMTFFKSFFSMSISDNTIYLNSVFGLVMAGGIHEEEKNMKVANKPTDI